MTQHTLEKDTQEDQRIMRQLGTVIAGFFVATVILALAVGITMG